MPAADTATSTTTSTTDTDTTTASTTAGHRSLSAERRDLIETLDAHREFLRTTARGLTDAQAAETSTVSALSVGGLIKHVAFVESGWADFIVFGTEGLGGGDEAGYAAHLDSFRMNEGETLTGLLERYDEVARRTDELVATLPDLDASHPLPEAPWFEPGASRSARRVFLHIVAETAQHAGHADIIREAIDGSRTMG
ncbi:MAG: DinB family protein [Ilumatobacteraceae bacterium]